MLLQVFETLQGRFLKNLRYLPQKTKKEIIFIDLY